MPITVLLIDNDREHAQALVSALADPWLGWRVDVTSSVQAARERLRQQAVDIVVCTQQVDDGGAFDVLETLHGVPAKYFGLLFGLNAIGIIGASRINVRLLSLIHISEPTRPY